MSVQTLRELVEAGAGELRWADGCARENPRREASLLLQAAVGLDRSQLVLQGNQAADPMDAARYWDLVRHRARGLPLQLLIGETGFHDVMLGVEQGVFIPRPETEILVDCVIEEVAARLAEQPAEPAADPSGASTQPGRPAASGTPGPTAPRVNVLDLCTGTGAVAVATAWRFRKDPRVHVSAGDWNPRAVRLARRNAESNTVSVVVRRSNLFSAFAGYEGTLDVLVSNPPYISPEEEEKLPLEVRLGDPSDALFDPDGGTGFHRRIAERGRDFLRPGGYLAMEIGDQQGELVRRVLEEAGYEDVAVRTDLNRRDRIVTGRSPKSTPSS